MKRRVFIILTVLALCLSLLPGVALAADEKMEDKSGGWVYPYVTLIPKETTNRHNGFRNCNE